MVVVAGKVFKLAEARSIADIASKLQNYRTEEPYEEGELQCTLISEIVNLVTRGDDLQGEYSHDYIIHVVHRDKVVPTPQTVRAVFHFIPSKQTVFLVVIQKKSVANFVANKLSELLFGKIGGVLEARIAAETIKEFQTENPEDTKITFFDNVDIPNMDKISLYGLDLNDTSLFGDYCKHGDLWYIVSRAKQYGYLVGLTREVSVTVFNLTDKEKFLEYLSDQIFPLIET